MALYKIKDFDPNYRDHFDGDDVKGLDLYSNGEKIGSVDDVLVDEDGRFRYLVINTGAWIFGKKVLMPIGQAKIDYVERRVYANGLTKEQVERLPEFSNDLKTDYDYEERVRSEYRPSGAASTSAGLDAPVALDAGSASYNATTPAATDAPIGNQTRFDRDSYNYDREPGLFNMNDQDHQNLRLYEERLIANKQRQKSGEVRVGKHVETETQRVSVPVEKERVVVERVAATERTPVAPGDVDFHEGEVARIEVYEETPDIRKEAYVREEVRVRKEVDRDTVEAEEQIRREQLDLNTDGRPVVDNRSDLK